MIPRRTWLAALALGGALAGASGCSTEAFCYADCPAATASATTSTHPQTGAGGGLSDAGTGQGGDCFPSCGEDAGGACKPTNGGVEACDGVDNDCNGTVDDGFDLGTPDHCGTCTNDCYALADNCAVAAITCKPGAKPGQKGTCQCGACDPGWVDRDGDGVTCEYPCEKKADDDSACNLSDDDCDGLVDEDVDFCSVDHCGGCNAKCAVAHGVAVCAPIDPQKGCKASGNAECKVVSCDCKGPGECFWHLDGDPPGTCNYACDPTNGGVEVCDGVDNDCDGKIDAADDLSKDAAIGVACGGGPKGECAAKAHQGATVCDGGAVKCGGPDVLLPGQVLETCNGKDDDCDGLVDDDPVDQGGTCGVSANAPCTKGTYQCLGGALVCSGNVDPAPGETCNGVDDDCNGVIDDGAADAIGDCEVPPPAPAGASSGCKKGVKACLGGTVLCQGAVKPAPGAVDGCNVDANCDGLLTGQPDLQVDAANCGACGNDCNAGAVHATFGCVAGVCVWKGCEPGYYDVSPKDQKCEYPCTYLHAQEACNGLDDNCDGQIDENVPSPSPVQVCGVSPGATAPECQAGAVGVACVKGAWSCAFPPGVCSPSCAAAVEVCDGLDNDCDGVKNENVANFGKACASDDGKPAPGDGACRTTGTFQCDGLQATKCSAVKADCANLPGGCAEVCDGVDNDCDGSIDEAFTAKGTNPTYWVKPEVVQIGGGVAGPWIFAYEASRPGAKVDGAGTGNGYFTAAPAGLTLDKTRACSRPSVIPWASVTPREVEQTCAAIGGRACSLSEWRRTCRVDNADGVGPNTPDTDNACLFGYEPLGAPCKSAADYAGKTRACNLGGFDFDPNTAGDQDGLLPTQSPMLSHCRALWDGYEGVATQSAWDVTGNLREATRCQRDHAICGADAAICAARCCSATSVVAGNTRLCGATARRLAGQPCAAAADCCDYDGSCAANGACVTDGTGALHCANLPAPAKSCRGVGVACSQATQCCGGEPCASGVCGGPESLPGAIYPLMGGSFVAGVEAGAACTFDFYKVDSTYKLYDTGFRCCFDAKPD